MYTNKELEIQAKTSDWRSFTLSKYGTWCRMYNESFFQELKKRYQVLYNTSGYTESKLTSKVKSMGWREFFRSKYGVWCKNNDIALFEKLRKQYRTTDFNLDGYKKEKLLEIIQENSWGYFANSKYGAWCKRNEPKLFKKLKKKYQTNIIDLREYKFQNEFQKRLIDFLNKKEVSYNLEREKTIKFKGKNIGRVDFVLTLNDFNLTLPLELKHGNSYWHIKEIEKQVTKYNQALKNQALPTYVISPKGKYGFSENEFINDILEYLFKTNYITLPNSLETIRNKK